MKLYVSNKNESPRMFENDFVDACSRWHWTSPLWAYVPMVLFLLYLSIAKFEVSLALTAGLFAAGAFAWTFAEYVLHRFVFHYQPKRAWAQRLHWILHGVHHDYPSDAWRLVMPLPISLPLAAIFYALFYFTLGKVLTPALWQDLLPAILSMILDTMPCTISRLRVVFGATCVSIICAITFNHRIKVMA